MTRTVLFAAAAVLVFSSCATVNRPPSSTSVDHGILIARAKVRGALIPFFYSVGDAGKIEAIDENGEPVPGLRGVSGLWTNGYFVFFDLPAGRYVLRGTSFASRGVRYQLVVPQTAPFKRSVVLRPGAAAFLGVYNYDAIWPEFWTALGRAGRIVGHWLTPWMNRPVLPRDADMRVYDSGPALEITALQAVRKKLAGTPWRRAVDARLRELSASEPVKTAGMLSRELPVHPEPFLSWRDTLKWGEPRRVSGGLGWRRPGGEAQIAVFFTSSTAPGFAGWDAAIGDLRRAAAASVEDSGEVYMVRVATRSGPAARVTTYSYPNGTLVGSVTSVILTETTLIPDGAGLFTMRLRAPREEFESALPAYREFLLQLVLGPPKPKAAKAEYNMPMGIAP